MDSATRSFDLDTQKLTPKPFSFPNGTLKKHLPPPPPGAAAADNRHQYRECLRNHAASLGGHAVDGCCEFMPSPSADPAVPTSLTCAACGCHRNFHRRLPLDDRLRHDDTDDDNDEESSEDDDGERRLRRRRRTSGSPPPYSSVPHMLLALSGAGAGARAGSGGHVSTQTMAAPITVSSGGFQAGAPPHAASGPMPRKRFRTKFSSEQKERMQEMSERLGWRMQKKDEAIVDEFCRQIGVERAVFKVWMHNNKHTYHGSPSSLRNEIGGSGGGGGGGGGEGNGLGSCGDNSGGNNYEVNGSPSSS